MLCTGPVRYERTFRRGSLLIVKFVCGPLFEPHSKHILYASVLVHFVDATLACTGGAPFERDFANVAFESALVDEDARFATTLTKLWLPMTLV